MAATASSEWILAENASINSDCHNYIYMYMNLEMLRVLGFRDIKLNASLVHVEKLKC